MIYDVRSNGFSIGMTFNYKEAQSWAASAAKATIHAIPYNCEQYHGKGE